MKTSILLPLFFLLSISSNSWGITTTEEGAVTIDFQEFTDEQVSTIRDYYLDYGILFSADGFQDIIEPPWNGPNIIYTDPTPELPLQDNYLCSNWVPWDQNGGNCRNDLAVRFVVPGDASQRVLVDGVSFALEGMNHYASWTVYWENTNGSIIGSQTNEKYIPITDLTNCWVEYVDPEQYLEVFTAPGPVGGFTIYNHSAGEPCAPNGGDGYGLDDITFIPYVPIDSDDIQKDDKDCPSQGAGFGNPCDAATGNKYQREVDIDVPNIGLSVVRHYSSQSKFDLGFGQGWTMPFYKRLIINNDSVRVYKGTGSSEGFVKRHGKWISSNEATLSLVDDATGYTVTWPNGDNERYNLSGLIVNESNKGKLITYNYDTNDQLISIVGPFGHTLFFTYSGTHIQSITDPDGRLLQYTYDLNDNLETVTYQDGTIRTYHYENQSFPNVLTGITDERGIRFSTYAYDSNGLVSLTQHALTSNGAPQEKFTLTSDSATQTTVVDPNGTIKTLIFDENLGNKNLISSTNQSDGKSVSQVFDARNNLVSRTDEESRITEYVYNSYNQRTQTRRAAQTPLEQVTNFSYFSNALNLITSIRKETVAPGGTYRLSYSYDSNLNLDIVTETGYDPLGNQYIKSIDYDFDTLGRVVRIDGPRTDVSDIRLIEYYTCSTGGECGQIKSTTNALGHVTTFNTYDNAGRLTKLTKPNGTVQEFTTDLRGRNLSVTTTPVNGAARTYSYTYGPDGRLKSTTTPEGSILTYDYDDAGYLATISDNLGNRIDYQYDLTGNKISEKTYDSSGILAKVHGYTYDLRNKISSVTSGNSVSQLVYDASGNLLQYIDANLNPTANKFDALNRVYESLDALSGLSRIEYNIQNNITQYVSPNGATTQFSYDDFGNTLSETSSDRGALSYSYDLANNKVSATDANGATRNMTYDAIGRLTSVTYPDDSSSNLSFSFDGVLPSQNGIGLLTQVSDQNGDITYYYDGLGSITKDIRTINDKVFVVEYSYNGNDQLVSMIYPSGRIITYTRDILGQITSVNNQAPGGAPSLSLLSGLTYSPFGPMNSGYQGNGHNLSVNYDTALRVTDWDIDDNSNSVQSLDYQYDPAGNITELINNTDPLASQSFDYDGLNRLDLASGNYGLLDYAYDANSNRTQFSNSSDNTVYGYLPSTNKLNSVDDSTTSWVYARDNNGSLISKLDSNGEGTLYGYSHAGQLISVTSRTLIPPKGNGPPKIEDVLLASYTYNGLGQRSSKTVGSEVTFYIYGLGGELIAEADDQGKIKAEYVYLNGRLIAMYQQSEISSEPAVPTETILDNGDADTSQIGTWTIKSSNKDYGADHLVADGYTSSLYTWNTNLPAGDYEVYAWWAATNKYSDNVPYTIVHNGTQSQVNANHSTNGQQWNLLGTFTFSGSGNEHVQVSDTNGKAVADALKFVSKPVPSKMSLYFVNNDALGTPKQLTDENGQLVWNYQHTPFGRGVPNNDVDGDLTEVNLNIRFPGQYFDKESGLSYNYFRYYDSSLGRYITSDPIGLNGGMNTYAYAGSNPLSFIDPLGLAGCYVGYPGFPITIPGTSTKVPLTHAGVLSYDSGGNTRYYEYGRYGDDFGNVRRQAVPELEIGPDGQPTPESWAKLMEALKRIGKGNDAETSCEADADAEKINEFAENRMNDPNRAPYSWMPWKFNTCTTFASDALGAGL